MTKERFSLRTVAKDPVATAKRADLPSLEEPMADVEPPEPPAPAPEPETVPEPAPAPVEAAPEPAPTPAPRARRGRAKAPPKTERPATRLGARGVTVWVDPALYREIKIAGLDADMTTQDLMMDAITQYLSRQRGRSKTA